MRILSQDGKIDVNYDFGNLSIASGRCEDVERAGIYFHSCSCPNATRLAEYTSFEKARKAMEMLREAYAGLPLVMRNIEFSEEDREIFKTLNKTCLLYSMDKEPPHIQQINNGYFQFPSDEDVGD